MATENYGEPLINTVSIGTIETDPSLMTSRQGCYQCSQRRIDCDGTRPSCLKCNARGFTCSGFEFTYRFIDGLAPTDRRRRRRPRNGSDPEPGWNSPGWNSPARFSSTETVDQNAKLTSNLPNHLEAYTPASPTSSQGSYSSPGSLSVPDLTPAFETIQSWNDDPPFCLDGGGSFQGEQGLETVEHPPLLDLTPNYDKLIDRTAQLPIHGLGCIAPWKEFLLDYCKFFSLYFFFYFFFLPFHIFLLQLLPSLTTLESRSTSPRKWSWSMTTITDGEASSYPSPGRMTSSWTPCWLPRLSILQAEPQTRKSSTPQSFISRLSAACNSKRT